MTPLQRACKAAAARLNPSDPVSGLRDFGKALRMLSEHAQHAFRFWRLETGKLDAKAAAIREAQTAGVLCPTFRRSHHANRSAAAAVVNLGFGAVHFLGSHCDSCSLETCKQIGINRRHGISPCKDPRAKLSAGTHGKQNLPRYGKEKAPGSFETPALWRDDLATPYHRTPLECLSPCSSSRRKASRSSAITLSASMIL